ncbi:MAG TPA: M20/M25/M40 family metallo-hydrolase [Anaeromyxobacteraceae bacterium]|nr:M20/M25/M40 family metallo-hydrolase [Anaeromyxobacteraceae bacterium]
MSGRAFLAGLAVLGAALAATWAGLRPPPPLPSSAPATAFSAERALPRLARILDAAGPGVPHPAGSEAGRRVRDQVVAELRGLGLTPVVSTSLACGLYLACAEISNVVARLPGTGGGRTVLVSAHHDSVPAGPGAADDGSGVAIALELARALRAAPPPGDVLLLFDDGEEIGLAGAMAFLSTPEAREVGAVVNLEARGTGGPSLLFETSGAGAEVVSHLAAGARRPVGSSLLSTIYALIPNDTNLTVLRRLGVPGANLAFVEGAVRYHTPRDDLGHLDPATVQQQGETALALVRGLAGPGPGPEPDRAAAGPTAAAEGPAVSAAAQAVWFDLLGRLVVRYPRGWAVPSAVLALLLALGVAVGAARRGLTGPGRIALGALSVPLALGVAAAVGLAAARAPRLDPVLRPWVAHPEPLVAAFFFSGLAAAALPAWLLGARAGAEGFRSGSRLALALASVVLAVKLPGASYLLVLPALAGGAVATAAAIAGRPSAGGAASDLTALLVGALVLLPPAWLLEPGLGHAAGPAAAAVLALVALPLAPLAAGLSPRARRLATGVPAVAAAACLALGLYLPGADRDAPERVVITFHQDVDAGTARILASADSGRLPPELRAAAPFSGDSAVRLGWGALRPAFAAGAPPLPDPAPLLEVLEARRDGAALRWRGRLHSPRGAEELQLAIPPEVKVGAARLEGVPVPRPVAKLGRWFGGWSVLRFPSRPGGVVLEMELTAASAGPVELVLADRSRALPPAAARVAGARPPWVVTVQEGDGTLFTRRVRIEADAAPFR